MRAAALLLLGGCLKTNATLALKADGEVTAMVFFGTAKHEWKPGDCPSPMHRLGPLGET